MGKKTVLILAYSHLESDPRVVRQINALKENYNVVTCGYSPSKYNDLEFVPIYKEPPFSLARKLRRLLQFLFKKFDPYYWDDGKIAIRERFIAKGIDIIIANDIPALPLALGIANDRARVIFDAHEYHLEEFEDSLRWRVMSKPFITFLCLKYIPLANAFTTVSNNIALKYETLIGKRPILLTNATEFHDLSPTPIDTNKIRLIHHGAAIESRKIELMIEMMDHTDERFYLDIILTGNNSQYIGKLKDIAKTRKRVRFVQPVTYDQLCASTNVYDLGIFLLPPTNFNYLNALPNKLYEFIQARLGIIVSPNPEMALLVTENNLGKVSEDYSPKSMATVLNNLTSEDIKRFKANAHQTASKLNAEENFTTLRNICKTILAEKE